MNTTITEEEFSGESQERLGEYWDRALALFRKCGKNLSWDISNVLLHAIDKNKVPEVLDVLEKHYEEHLQYQHPRVRGQMWRRFDGRNLTKEVFTDICQKTLGLQPVAV